MLIRRVLAGVAIALIAFVGLASPVQATATPTPPYPLPDTSSTAPTEVEGAGAELPASDTEDSGSGLPGTGGSLEPLWVGLALLGAGGVLVAVFRSRRGAKIGS